MTPKHSTVGPEPLSNGALEQSVRLAFLALTAVTILLGLVWLTGNIRSVPADSNAIVIRYGRVVAVRHSGLVAALPRPFENVYFVPSQDKQISLHVNRDNTDYNSDETDLELQESDDFYHMERNRDAANASYLLTGDGNVIRLDASLFYRILRPVPYMQARSHVSAALRRIFYAAATDVAASHAVEDFLVVHSPLDAEAEDDILSARRAALRSELLAAVNTRLSALHGLHTDLGIEIARIDLMVILPPRAKEAFDQVLTAEQSAAQNVASARTDAERIIQTANRERDRIGADAEAAAVELTHRASEETASISAVESAIQHTPPGTQQAVAIQAWRDKASAVLAKAGQVVGVAPDTGQIILGSPTVEKAAQAGQGEGSSP
ncbi:SPFH domain-containing protein (plasmid) [Kozakia baliensis]|uniref:SPFH domain-containing protein n=1 Tax=Kozakia baliensis TaxID=153496 RepID=UPI00345C0F19